MKASTYEVFGEKASVLEDCWCCSGCVCSGHVDLCGRHTVMSLQVPSPPGDEDEDFILVHHSEVQLSDKAEQVYAQLMKILREQYEVCLQDGD